MFGQRKTLDLTLDGLADFHYIPCFLCLLTLPQVHSISNGQISKSQAFEIASTNIDALLGLDSDDNGDLVATRGGDLLGFEGKVVGVVQKKRGIVDLF